MKRLPNGQIEYSKYDKFIEKVNTLLDNEKAQNIAVSISVVLSLFVIILNVVMLISR